MTLHREREREREREENYQLAKHIYDIRKIIIRFGR